MIAVAEQTRAATGAGLSVRQACQTLGVSRSWYYAARTRQPARATTEAMALRDAIERIVLDYPGYGYRRVTAALHRAGWCVNHKRVARILREESLQCQLQRRFVVTTDSAHAHRTYPHLLKAVTLTATDQAWVADLTYIQLPTTFVYLAAILDAYSRRCVGWRLSRQIDHTLTLAALDHALAQRQPAPGLIHHSDRGGQYACGAYVDRLHQRGVQISMSAVGNPYDNAKAESFFKTLKHEEVYLQHYTTFAEAHANLTRFIDDVYNTKRLHSSLGYVPPAEFEASLSTNLTYL